MLYSFKNWFYGFMKVIYHKKPEQFENVQVLGPDVRIKEINANLDFGLDGFGEYAMDVDELRDDAEAQYMIKWNDLIKIFLSSTQPEEIHSTFKLLKGKVRDANFLKKLYLLHAFSLTTRTPVFI